MAERGDLEAAAQAGVISAAQVEPLLVFLDGRRQPAPTGGEEDLRFIRNFHDVFLAIGIVLFAAGMAIGIGAFCLMKMPPREMSTLYCSMNSSTVALL